MVQIVLNLILFLGSQISGCTRLIKENFNKDIQLVQVVFIKILFLILQKSDILLKNLTLPYHLNK